MNTIEREEYTIGSLAKAAEINLETIRYYQRIGLITEPRKPLQGYRKYPYRAVETLRFIKRAQQLGFSLAEIAELLDIGDGHCEDIRDQAIGKQSIIDAQIRDLQALSHTLGELIDKCNRDSDTGHCPLIEVLQHAPQ